MKKISAIICMIMIMFIMAPCASAAGLEIVSTSPKNGADDVPLENLGVKVFFNQDVYSKENEKANKKACKLVDSKGKEIESLVIFNAKNKDEVLVLAKTEDKNGKTIVIKPTADYKLHIDKSFTAASGETFDKAQVVEFKTLNPTTSTTISMVMMFVMMGGMVFFSARSAKKEEEKEHPHKEEKFNPYKAAKESGKSLAEVIEEENKRREKEATKEAKKAKHHHDEDFSEFEEEEEEYMEPGHYKVKGVRTVAQGGSTYITGRKAEAEKKAAIEAKIKAAKEAQKKGKKGKGKKKKK